MQYIMDYEEFIKWERALPDLSETSINVETFHEDVGYDFRCVAIDHGELVYESEFDLATLSRLSSADFSNFDKRTNFSVRFTTPYLVQKRRHKKWRINKKWAKRYGYKVKFKSVEITEMKIRDDSIEAFLDGMWMEEYR